MSQEKQNRLERYDSLDGLRAFAAIGVIMLHVYTNGGYEIKAIHNLLLSFSDLVFLFMIISGFSMCCGYYQKFIDGNISVTGFYAKRYAKTLPFFAFLTGLDLLINPSLEALFEGFANLTLCFGLLPNHKISVIGVGWTLGVIFVFYLIFPFFCYLLSSKKRAWLSFGIALIFNLLCECYFFDSNHMLAGYSYRSNFIYCAVFFFAGGLIFLYREQIVARARELRFAPFAALVALILMYWNVHTPPILLLPFVYSLLVAYAISLGRRRGVLKNVFTGMISQVSMEIYLCHMVIFRILEKLNIPSLLGGGVWSFICTTTLTFLGAIVFALLVQYGLQEIPALLKNVIARIKEIKFEEFGE